MKALLIEWDTLKGKRPGDINPNDPGLQCYGWQKLNGGDSLEIRLIEDDRPLDKYKELDGVTVLETKEELENAKEFIDTGRDKRDRYIQVLEGEIKELSQNIVSLHEDLTEEKNKSLWDHFLESINLK